MSTDANQSNQSLPVTPHDALGPIVREQVIIQKQSFWIERPKDSDHLVDHPAIRAAFHADEYLPYWTDLWPAARMLAKVLLQESWPLGTSVLEVGCGLGLPGIVALSQKLRVTFSDVDATALDFAAHNARLNGFEEFELLRMDWRNPPPGLRVPLLLGSDLIYELRHINPLVALIKHAVEPGGLCLLTDQNRLPAYNLTDALIGEGLPYTTQIVRAGEPGGRRVKGTLYRITLPASS